MSTFTYLPCIVYCGDLAVIGNGGVAKTAGKTKWNTHISTIHHEQLRF